MADLELAEEYAATGGEYVPSSAEVGDVVGLSKKDKGFYTDMLARALVAGVQSLAPSITPTEHWQAQHAPSEIIVGATAWLQQNVDEEWSYEFLEDLMAGFDIQEGFRHAWAQVLPETPQWNVRNVIAANNPISFVSDLWREFPIEIGFLGIGTRDKGEGHRGRMEGRGTNPYTSTPLGNLVGVHDWADAIDITLDLLDLGMFTGGTVIRTALRNMLLRGERRVVAKISDKAAQNIPISVFEQQRMVDFRAFEAAHGGDEEAMRESVRIFAQGPYGGGWTTGYHEAAEFEKLAQMPLPTPPEAKATSGPVDSEGNPLWEAEARAESGPPEEGPPGTPASGRAHHEEGWPAAGGPRSVENDPGWVSDFHPDYDDSWMTLADIAEIREVPPLGVTDEMLADAVDIGMIEQANADGLQAELRERKRIVLEGLEGPPGTPEREPTSRVDDDLIDRYPQGYMPEDFVFNEPIAHPADKPTPANSPIERLVEEGEITRDQADALHEGVDRIRIQSQRANDAVPEATIDKYAGLTGTVEENKEHLYAWSRRINELFPAGRDAMEGGDELMTRAFRLEMDAIHAEIEEYAARFPSIREDTEWSGMRDQIAAYRHWRAAEQQRLGPRFDESPVPDDASQAIRSGNFVHGLPVENIEEVLEYIRMAAARVEQALEETLPWGAWSQASSDAAMSGIDDLRAAVPDARVQRALDEMEARIHWADEQAEMSEHPLRHWQELLDNYMHDGMPETEAEEELALWIALQWSKEPAIRRLVDDIRVWISRNPVGERALIDHAEEFDDGLLKALMDPTSLELQLDEINETVGLMREQTSVYDGMLGDAEEARVGLEAVFEEASPSPVPHELEEMIPIWMDEAFANETGAGPWPEILASIEGLTLRQILDAGDVGRHSDATIVDALQVILPQMRGVVKEWDEMGKRLGDEGFEQLLLHGNDWNDPGLRRVKAFSDMMDAIRRLDEGMEIAGVGVFDDGMPHGVGIHDDALDLPLLPSPGPRMTPIRQEWLDIPAPEREAMVRDILTENPNVMGQTAWRRIAQYLDNGQSIESIEELFSDSLRQQVADWHRGRGGVVGVPEPDPPPDPDDFGAGLDPSGHSTLDEEMGGYEFLPEDHPLYQPPGSTAAEEAIEEEIFKIQEAKELFARGEIDADEMARRQTISDEEIDRFSQRHFREEREEIAAKYGEEASPTGLGPEMAEELRAMGVPEEQATDPLFQEFAIYSQITGDAEKSHILEPFSPESLRIMESDPYEGWKAFSRSRGYTEEEIADFEHWLHLVEQVDAKYPVSGFSPEGIEYAPDTQSFIHLLSQQESVNFTNLWQKYGGMFGFAGLAIAGGVEYSNEPQIRDWDSFATVMWGADPASSFGRAMKVAGTTGTFNEGLDPRFSSQLERFINDSNGEVQPLMGRMDPADYKHLHQQLLQSDPELATELGPLANTAMTNGRAAMLHYPNSSHWALKNAGRYGLMLREGFDHVVEPMGERLKQGPTDFSGMTEADKVRHFMEVAEGTMMYRDPPAQEATG